jgi:hypothetical protein
MVNPLAKMRIQVCGYIRIYDGKISAKIKIAKTRVPVLGDKKPVAPEENHLQTTLELK